MIYVPDICDPRYCEDILAKTALANVKKLIHLFRLALASSNLKKKIARHSLKMLCTQKGFQHIAQAQLF